MTKCIKCGAEATARFSPDMDIEGIGACAEHKEEIRNDLFYAVILNTWKTFNKKYNIKNNKNASNRKITK